MRKMNNQILVALIVLVVILILTIFAIFNNEKFIVTNSSVIVADDIIIFPEPSTLIEIEINTKGRELPASKDDGDLPVMLKLTAGGTTIETYGEIKVQGTSTARWPKKNWTLKFYKDQTRTEKLKIKIGDSIASDMWIAKADWIDPTMLRNPLSYNLWESMVLSRKSLPIYEVDNAWIGNDDFKNGTSTAAQGFPEIYTARVKVNEEHYGISNLILGHDPDNFNIDKDNPKHIYMEFDARFGYTKVKTWEKFKSEGLGEWIEGYYPETEDFTKEQKKAIDNLGKLVNGSLSNFKKNFNKYLDKTNMIDMLLFIEATGDWDGVAQDLEMVTYDLKKWYMLPWDKDTTFGMNWDESGLQKNSEKTLIINYKKEDPSQKPWYKTYHSFKSDVEKRYAELRRNGVFTVKNLYNLISDVNKKIPQEIWNAEFERWEEDERPSLDETSSAQILSWFEKRLKTLDKQFNY